MTDKHSLKHTNKLPKIGITDSYESTFLEQEATTGGYKNKSSLLDIVIIAITPFK